MKKVTIILLVLGAFGMSFQLLTQHFFAIPLSVMDFMKGLGVALILSALYVQFKLQR